MIRLSDVALGLALALVTAALGVLLLSGVRAPDPPPCCARGTAGHSTP